jgi:glucosyl-3-phosphoglycerate phosphatase
VARKLVLWRHGRTAWNHENRFQGQTDIPLDETGVEQATRAAALLASFAPHTIICSDLGRAQATAAPLLALTGLRAVIEPGIRETHGGEWEGRTGADIRSTDAENFNRWVNSEDVIAGGTGERRSDVAARAVAAIERSLEALPDNETLIAVTHGGTARCVIATLLGLPADSWGVIGGLANCSWSVLEETYRPDGARGWRLVEHNAGTLPEPVLGDESGAESGRSIP